MIYGHITGGYDNVVEYALFMFMQYFFFHSGSFSKEFQMKEIMKYIVPYIKFSLLGLIIYELYKYGNDGNIRLKNEISEICYEFIFHWTIKGNGPLWFLIDLCVIKIIYSFIKKENYIWIIIISSFTAGLLLNKLGFFEPVWFANLNTGISFFGLGKMLKNNQYNKYLFCLMTIIYLLIAIFYPSHLQVHNNQMLRGSYFMCYIASIGGIIFYNNIFKFIKCKPLEYIGTNAMTIYIWHLPMIYISKIILIFIGCKEYISNTYICATMLILEMSIMFLNNYIEDRKVEDDKLPKQI